MSVAFFHITSIALLIITILQIDKKFHISPASVIIGILILIIPFKFLFLDIFEFNMPILKDYQYLHYSSIAFFAFSLILFLTLKLLSIYKVKFIKISFNPTNHIVKISYITLALLILLVISRYGFLALFDPVLIRKSAESSGALYLTQFYLLSVSLAIVYVSDKNFIFKIFFYFVHFTFSIVAGRPGWLFIYLLNILLLSNVRQKKLPIFSLLAVILLFPLLAVFILRYRLAKNEFNTVFEALTEALNSFANTDLSEIASFILLRTDQLEHFSNYVGLLYESKIFSSFSDIFHSLIQFIPRFILPEKPLNFSADLTSTIYPEVYAIGVTNNFLGISEFIHYFGFSGIFICGIFMGYLLKLINVYFKESYSNIYIYNVFFNILFIYAFQGIMSGFFNEWALQCLILNVFYMNLIGKWGIIK
tara:strand:- start:586 stop:1845 length:1260 start_codon:yes stop_codon:yes gene_type:complete